MKSFISLLLVFALPLFSQQIVSVTTVSQLTGENSLNQTDNVNVWGADLGTMFLHSDGRIYFLFGDTFGSPGNPSVPNDWRSNTMAYTTDFDASDGIAFDGWITDDAGMAQALVPGDHGPNDGSGEVTKIPTAGWSYDGRQFMWFMSVKQWGQAGEWDVNYAEIAYSDDDGQTWAASGVRWPGSSNFIQADVKAHDGFLYVFGIPAGRFGGVKLARVGLYDILNQAAYRYYTGSNWSETENDAVTLVGPPVGEFSVLWNPYLQRWMMMYLNENKTQIEMRQAPELQGPWSEPLAVVGATSYPGLYGAYMHETYIENDGEVVYFLMSRWFDYNVFVMRLELEKPAGAVANHSSTAQPSSCILYQNYPNPFNAQTRIRFELAWAGRVRLEIFDMVGRKIRTLVNDEKSAGQHAVVWDGTDAGGHPAPSGVYVLKLSSNRDMQFRKTMLLK